MDFPVFRRIASYGVMVSAAGLVACGGDTSPTGTEPSSISPVFVIADPNTATPEFSKIKVCKSATSNVSGTFTISRAAVGASSGTALSTVTLAPGNCVVVAEDNGGANVGSNITVTETSAGLISVTGQRIDADVNGGPDVISGSPFTNGDSRFLNSFHGFTITFENFIEVPPPPTGGQGCSPGYWKNHNFPAGYSKNQLFSSVFENAFPGKSLQTVLSTGGGGLTALGRHTVSALFNAAALGSNYELTVAQVIAKFNAVFPGGNYSGLAAEFAALQDVDGRICPNPTGK